MFTPLALVALLVVAASDVRAGDAVPFEARQGLALAQTAAHAWASDAALVWVENDDVPDPTGTSTRWGYLFYSPAGEKARAYSVKDGKIVTAENLDMTFDAPPVAADWIDSGRAFAAADEARAKQIVQQPSKLANLVLARGTMDAQNPDRTTWTVVYATPNQPSLFVVVDATSGKVLRTWKG